MKYNKVNSKIIGELSGILGEDYVMHDPITLNEYGKDHTENLVFPPEVLVKPSSTDQVARILFLAQNENIPVTAIGARTGLSGGCLSVHGGIGISMERFNKIIHIDCDNICLLYTSPSPRD